MSARIVEILQEFVDVSTGLESVCAIIEADDYASLPQNSQDRVYLLGSEATTVDTGRKYKIDSTGTWVLQPDSNITINVPDFDELEDRVTTAESAIDAIGMDGSKNKLQNTATSTGIFTVNDDGTVTAEIPASNSQTSLTLFSSTSDVSFDHDMVLSGCPSGGGYTYRWSIYLLDSNGNLIFVGSDGMADQGDTVVVPANTAFRSVRILIRANIGAQTLTFKPMLCDKDLYELSSEYIPYAPTNRELYEADKTLDQIKFTPETSLPTTSQRLLFTSPKSNNNLTMLVGKLNSTTNYVQFYVNGVDKGYLTFDVSRNIDTWQ